MLVDPTLFVHLGHQPAPTLNTVVPGFRALGLSTALDALNPGSALNQGTTAFNNLEIVNGQLMVDRKNLFFFQKPPKNWNRTTKNLPA